MTYLGKCANLMELKREYKRLAKLLHPDMGGSDAEMARLNDEYDVQSLKLPAISAEGKEYEPTVREAPEAYRAAVLAVLRMDGVELELCGAWLWAGGNTRPHTALLKAAGYRWSANKCMWYWRPDGYRKHGGKRFSMEEVRALWGSESVTVTERTALPV